jgi:hypothetical protein
LGTVGWAPTPKNPSPDEARKTVAVIVLVAPEPVGNEDPSRGVP